ncbi:cupredoxin domain-containing protein [Natrinema sp. 74]|uniref:cupredoxin domain-containing protein n=1 Tax=Natrinema sp. 74 TaxID=3384159 RepID=UPI0038D468BE
MSQKVFGTPDDPKSLVQPVIERAKKPPIKQLLREFPILVGLPPKARAVSADGNSYTHSKIPTPFSDHGEVIDGSFDITYVDRQAEDGMGKPTQSQDEVKMRNVRFTDPQGNEYTLEQKTIFQPPIPGYQTGGGVFTNRYHHGLTGTGSPLMPRVYSWGASYSLGSIVANGEVVDKNRVFHWMTTQTVRTENYRLAIEEELPLAPEDTIAGQIHHTHLIVLPVKITSAGVPEFQPVNIPYTGTKQPFMHIMYEEDEVTEAPFDPPQRITQPDEETRSPTTQEEVPGILIEGSEFFFDPHTIRATPGEKVVITFRNVGSIAHNFVIGDLGVRTPTIQPGQTATVRFTPEQPDVYGFWCAVPGHQDAGMQGRLVVEEQGATTDNESTSQ